MDTEQKLWRARASSHVAYSGGACTQTHSITWSRVLLFKSLSRPTLVKSQSTIIFGTLRTQELLIIYPPGTFCPFHVFFSLVSCPHAQTLRALKALHSANVLHRDLKLSSLLLNSSSSRSVHPSSFHQTHLSTVNRYATLARTWPAHHHVANDSSTSTKENVATRCVSFSSLFPSFAR